MPGAWHAPRGFDSFGRKGLLEMPGTRITRFAKHPAGGHHIHHADDVVADVAPTLDARQHASFDDIPHAPAPATVQLGQNDAIGQLDRDAATSIDPKDRSALEFHRIDAARGLVNDV
jgi:hypothetical protein